jgi:hypothetical protein
VDEILYAVFILRALSYNVHSIYAHLFFPPDFLILGKLFYDRFPYRKRCQDDSNFWHFLQSKKECLMWVSCVCDIYQWITCCTELFCFFWHWRLSLKLIGSSSYQEYWAMTECTLYEAINVHYVSVNIFTDLV